MLTSALCDVRTIADLDRLFTILGYTGDNQPFDEEGQIIARWKGFRVVAVDSNIPRDGARLLARRLAAASERALAVSVGPPGEIALAAPRFGQPGITRVLAVSLTQPSAFALQQLERLRPNGSATALGHALHVAEILSSEEVGDRFFVAFRVVLERMAASLGSRGSAADRRMMALLSLTRILFLYFVQAKGWLDGRSNYLRSLLDHAIRRHRHFHRTVLRPLFFGTLNRPPEDRSGRLRLGDIPYLNGGLFEPHPLERSFGLACFSNELWRDAFDELFERFRFCVREADEVDAVAPDMLGRVFERLMDGGARHDTGTFYTPASVVRQVVDAAIETALTRDLSPDVARRVVMRQGLGESDRRTARRALSRMRVLDPAVGSGAFLLGALEALSEMLLAVEPRRRRDAGCQLRREILRDNLFGVDLNPVAVRLAELRLWLAVVADEPTVAIRDVTPLPNLDGVIRQGDTLLDPLSAARLFAPAFSTGSSWAAASVRNARKAMFDARGKAQRRSLRDLRRSETSMAHLLLDQAAESTQRAIDDLAAAARSRDLFGKRTGLSSAQRERHRALKRTQRDIAQARRQLTDGALPFFSFEVHAPDILAEGGFSIVIANPPWVRAERLTPARRRALKERFNWWRGGSGRGFVHLPDLSIAFLERCLELVAPSGAVALLVPSKIISAAYGETARRGLVRETSIAYVHRVPDKDAARFGATTYPLALVVKKERPPPNHTVQLGFARRRSLPQRALDTPGPWILLPGGIRGALREFRASGRPLRTVAPPILGVKTGADKIFLGQLVATDGSTAEVQFGNHRITIERSSLRPALRGRDVRAFSAKPQRVILWAHDGSGAPLRHLAPRAAGYVEQQSPLLLRRSDYRTGPLWSVFRVRGATADNRVVWPDIARRPRAVALDETEARTAIPLNTCYVSPAPDRETALVIAAVLNSIWAMAFTAVSADEARGGYRRMNAHVIEQIPVPDGGLACVALTELSQRAHRHEHATNEDLDEAVANALGLSARTRRHLRALAADYR